MIWQTQGLGYSVERVSKNLDVDKSTLYRTVQRFISTTERAARKLTDLAKLFILQLVLEKPRITLREIQEQLLHTLLIAIDIANICRVLQQSGFTKQKLQITALQWNEHLRQCYIEEVSIYNPDMLIFLDETGADRRNAFRSHGDSMQGKPLVISYCLEDAEFLQ